MDPAAIAPRGSRALATALRLFRHFLKSILGAPHHFTGTTSPMPQQILQEGRSQEFGHCNAQVGALSLIMQPHDETKIASSTNDYYPFIVNAVSKLEQSTPESRRVACEQAREALVAGLRHHALRI